MQGPYPPLPSPGMAGVEGYSRNPAFQQQGYPPPSQNPWGDQQQQQPPQDPYNTYPPAYPPAYPQPGGDGSYTNAAPVLPMQQDDDCEAQRYRNNMVSSQGARRYKYLIAFTSFVLWMLFYTAHIELGCACGWGGKWLVSLVPILVGPIVFGFVLYFLLKCVIHVCPYEVQCERDRRTVTIATFVWVTVCVIATGIPFSMTCGQAHAADEIRQATRQAQIHCWKNPNDNLSGKYFLSYLEYQWKVDWQNSWKQKMKTISGTEEDEDASSRYNFCVAPIVYTGAGDCKYNLWTGCFKQTSFNPAASCGASEAALCGWTFPASGVTSQILFNDREFYNPAESDELSAYKDAVKLATVPAGKQNPVIVYWSSEGPESAEKQYDTAVKSIQTQRICFYIIIGLTLLIHAMVMLAQ